MHRRRLRRLRRLIILPAALCALLALAPGALALPPEDPPGQATDRSGAFTLDTSAPRGDAGNTRSSGYVLDTSAPRGDAGGTRSSGYVLDTSAPRGDSPATRAVPPAEAPVPNVVRTVIRDTDPALPIVLSAIALLVALAGSALALARVARMRDTIAAR